MAFAVVLIVLVIAGALAFASPRGALQVAVFFAPWTGLGVDVGLSVTAYLVFMAPLAVTVIVRALLKRSGQRFLSSLGIFWLVVAYAVLWSLVQVPFLPEQDVAGGLWRAPGFRAITQILRFFIALSPILVVPLVLREREDIRQLAKIYLGSVFLLATIGWGQLAVWNTTGANPIPIGFTDQMLGGTAATRSGQFLYDGQWVLRMNSFGGEPKGMGTAIAVALLLFQAGLRPKGNMIIVNALWCFLFVSMMATFSTTALLAWCGATLVQLATTDDLRFRFSRVPSRHSRWLHILLLFLVVTVLMIILVAPGSRWIEILEAQTLGRIAGSDMGLLEDFNEAVLSYLLAEPAAALTGVGLGNIHLYADSYLPLSATRYAAGTTFVAKSSLLRWISEIGVVALLVFTSWVLSRFHDTVAKLRKNPETRSWSPFVAKASVSILAFWLVSGYIEPQLFLVIGSVLTLGRESGWSVSSGYH